MFSLIYFSCLHCELFFDNFTTHGYSKVLFMQMNFFYINLRLELIKEIF